MGGVEQVNTHPSEVFRGAIVMAAPEILIAHNHMDGMVRPSVPDIMFTMNCLTAGAMLGIRVRDHIVVGPNNKHMSIRENHHDLRSEFAQAERQMFGMGGMGNLTDIKEKLLSILDPSGKGLPYPGAPKKSGDPSANTPNDWKQSLSYQYLNSK